MSLKNLSSKRIILLSLLTLPLASLGAFALAKQMNLAKVSGDQTKYAFTLDGSNAPATYGDNVEVAATALGNSLKFNYVGASASAGNHMALSDGGYIQNVNKLMDLVDLTVNGTGTFKLHTGFEGYENVKTFTVDSASELTEFANVSYFKLEAVGNAVVNSITGDVTCQETPGRDLDRGIAGDTPLYDVCEWNRLVHDIDASQDFEFTVSFRQITDEAERLKRPTYYIFPAEYDENDEILHTETSHFYDGTGGTYQARQSSSHMCRTRHYNSEKDIGADDSWLGSSVTGHVDGQFGGTDTKQARITRNCIMTVTFHLENRYEDGQRYQHFFLRQDCQSFAFINNIDYSGNYTKTYTLDNSPGDGNIFPCERIGIAIAVQYAGTYTFISASSTGVR